MIFTWIFSCPSAEARIKSEELAKSLISLDRVDETACRAYPGGVEKTWIRSCKLGDYFDSIELQHQDDLTYKLIFRARNGVNSWWKDLVVKILSSLARNGVSTTIQYGKPKEILS